MGVGAAAFSGALAFANLGGKATAQSGAHGTVGAGGVTVKADGTHTARVQTLNVNVGAIAIGLTVARAANGRSTEAWVTSTGNISTTGAVLVEATATNTADTTQVFPQIDAGGASMSILVRFSVVSGFTKATVDGDFSNASSITVSSSAQNTASTDVAMIGLSVVGLTGVYASAEITSAAGIETVIDSTASLSGTGPIVVEAKTKGTGNRATATAGGAQFGGVAASALILVATLANPVKVTLDGDLTTTSSASTVGSPAIAVRASSSDYVQAKIFLVAASLFSGNVSVASGELASTATTNVVGGSTSSASAANGRVEITAGSSNLVEVETNVGAGGALFGVAVTVPSATLAGATTASMDGDITAAAGGVLVEATSNNRATVDVTVLALGGLGGAAVNVAHAEITSAAVTDAVVGSTATVSAPAGAVEVKATSTNSASATTTAVGAGIGGSVNVQISEAIVAGRTKAEFNGTIPSTGTKTASLLVQTRGRNQAIADLEVLTVSAGLSGTAVVADAEVTSAADTQALVGSTASINVSGSVIVDSQLTTGRERKAELRADEGLRRLGSAASRPGLVLDTAIVAGSVEAKLNGARRPLRLDHDQRRQQDGGRRRHDLLLDRRPLVQRQLHGRQGHGKHRL